MAKISAKKRLQGIVSLLEKEGYVSGQELAKEYHVSMETSRKDLTYLEKIGIADKEYGGALLTLSVASLKSILQNSSSNFSNHLYIK